MPSPDELSAASRTTGLRKIKDFQFRPPPTWAKIAVKPEDSDWALDASNRLCDDPDLRYRLGVGLFSAQRELLGRDPHIFAAVWVPDRSVGDVEGMLHVDWIIPDQGHRLDRPYYRALLERTKRKVELLTHQVDELELPAGPALRIHERTSWSAGWFFARRKEVFEWITYVVFPHDSSDALGFKFSTDALHLAEALGRDADAAMPTVTVILGEPYDAT